MAKRHFDRHATPALASDFDEFRQENSEWLRSFGLFMALKDQNGGASIVNWPLDDRSYARVAATGIAEGLSEPALQWEFNQWLFFRQWRQLREYVQRRGVELIGDAPIFAAMDSADVWANPELFCLDELGLPTAVAGVPPDYFARTGQLWGNPLYSWEEHERSDYKWWIRRIRSLLQLVDFVRLDHFRGFAAYWEVPSRAPTAESGRWAPGPAGHFLDRLMMAMDATPERQSLPLIAEDLGVATPDVTRLLGAYNLPGMRVLQFGFTGFQEDNLPHSYPVNCVAYTATHDNDTSRGWFTAATQRQKQAALAYLGCTEATIVVHMMDAIWRSQSVLTIVPAQDLLNLGSEARMNHPGKAQGYWEWRLPQAALTESLALELRALNARWSRLVHA